MRLKWTKHKSVTIPGMAYNGPAWTAEVPCTNGAYRSSLTACVPLCNMNERTGKFDVPVNCREHLFCVCGVDSGGYNHIMHAERFATLGVAKREASLRAQIQASYIPRDSRDYVA